MTLQNLSAEALADLSGELSALGMKLLEAADSVAEAAGEKAKQEGKTVEDVFGI